MDRFIPGLFLAILIAVLAFDQGLAQGQGAMSELNLNSSASSVQASPDDESMASIEAAGGQEAVNEAEDMDQLIQTISDSEVTEEAAESSGTVNADEIGQPTQAPEDDSSSAAGVDQGSGTIEEAEEMDQLIQVLVEDEGSTNEGVEADQDAGTVGKEEVTNLSVGIFSEDVSDIPMEAGQESESINQTQSMSQLIQTFVDSDIEGNNSSETVQDIKSINETKPTATVQSMQKPAKEDGTAVAETVQQAEIVEKTESIGILIQTFVDNESSTDTMTDSSTEIIEKTESIGQLIETLESEGDEATGSDELAGGQDLEIIDKEGSMELLIQALEGSDV
jgi:hypothetical protein